LDKLGGFKVQKPWCPFRKNQSSPFVDHFHWEIMGFSGGFLPTQRRSAGLLAKAKGEQEKLHLAQRLEVPPNKQQFGWEFNQETWGCILDTS